MKGAWRQHAASGSGPRRSDLFYFGWFAEILRTVGLSAAGETIILGITGGFGYFFVFSVAAEHAEMSVMIGATGAFFLLFH